MRWGALPTWEPWIVCPARRHWWCPMCTPRSGTSPWQNNMIHTSVYFGKVFCLRMLPWPTKGFSVPRTQPSIIWNQLQYFLLRKIPNGIISWSQRSQSGKVIENFGLYPLFNLVRVRIHSLNCVAAFSLKNSTSVRRNLGKKKQKEYEQSLKKKSMQKTRKYKIVSKVTHRSANLLLFNQMLEL